MADEKKNPLIGAFRAPVPGAAPPNKPPEPPKAPADGKPAGPATPDKPSEEKKPVEPSKAPADGKPVGPAVPGKPGEEKKPVEPSKAPADGKPIGPAALGKPGEEKKPAEPPKAPADGKPAGPAGPGKPGEEKKPAEPPKGPTDGKPAGTAAPGKPGDVKKPIEPPKAPVDGKPTGPAAPAKSGEEKKPTAEGNAPTPPSAEDEIPKNFTLPITKTGQSEIITTLKVSEISKFEGHPFNVKDDQDMWDLVESVKQFGVLEPVVVIPRKAGGYEMVSGHRRQRACQLAGIETMPVIVRNLDRDEATISMVDANLKRENITPMEKARAYSMKLEAMKRKAGRLSKADILNGAKPMRADEQLAQQTGESRANIQKITRLTKLEPELQKMVDKKMLPVHTAADISYLKKEEQKTLADAIEKEGGTVPSGSQAAALKKESQAGSLTPEKIEKTVAPTKREVEPPLKVTFSDEELRSYFPGDRVTVPEVKRTVFEALDLRKRALARQASKEGKEVKDKKPGLAR